MARGSERIAEKWLDGAKRECVSCGMKITNLDKQVGVIRTTYYPKLVTEILCMDCRPGVKK